MPRAAGKVASKVKKASAKGSAVKPATKKTVTRSKATAPKSAKADQDRSDLAWLVRDKKMLLESIRKGMEDIFSASEKLRRDPVSVLRYIGDGGLSSMLSSDELDFTFLQGSEESCEFMGLALSGVPLISALRWCLCDPQRPSAAQLDSAMTSPDLRPAMDIARQAGLWLTRAAQVADLRVLAQYSLSKVMNAVAGVIDRFEIPTLSEVCQELTGGGKGSLSRSYPWGEKTESKTPPSTTTIKRGGKSAYRTKSAGGRRRGRKRASSPSYAGGGAVVADTRSAKDKAWETKTHW